jgi:RNA polymerase sigma-70 factor (ECF subfamily)
LVKLETEPANEPAFDASELAAGLEQLDEELREVVVARIWGGLGFTEIGEILGQSTTTAFRKFQSGLTALRRILEEPCPTFHETNQSITTDRPENTK